MDRPPSVLNPSNGLTVYDVVSRQNKIVDRVQIPDGARIVGFGTGGIVYLAGPCRRRAAGL